MLWFDIFRIRRDVILANLQIAFPQMPTIQKIRIGRASCCNMGYSFVDYFLFPFIDKKFIAENLELEGFTNYQKAVAKNKGAFMLAFHLGAAELGTACLSKMGLPIVLISKKFKSEILTQFWFNLRARAGTRFIAHEKSSFEILREIKKKNVVIFVLDQFMGPPIGVETHFFSKSTGTAVGLALFAERTQAPVVPAYCVRLPGGKLKIVFEPEIPFEECVDPTQNKQYMTQKYTDLIESVVKKYPEQWMWVHRRWKPFR